MIEGEESNDKMYFIISGSVSVIIKKKLDVFEKEN
jgi:hypothetical protein